MFLPFCFLDTRHIAVFLHSAYTILATIASSSLRPFAEAAIAHTVDIPNAVTQAASKTWVIKTGKTLSSQLAGFAYIPVTLLSDALVGSKANLTSWSSTAGFSNPYTREVAESDLSIPDYLSGLRRLMQLVKRFFPEGHAEWNAHYAEHYWGGSLNEGNWVYMREYDIALRTNAFPHTQPVMDAPDIVRTIKPRVDKRIREDLLAAMSSTSNAYVPRLASNPTYKSNALPQAFQTTPTSNSFQQPHPSSSSSFQFRPKANASFRYQSKQFCFICAGSDHTADRCNAAVQVNGKPIYIRTDGPKPTLPNGDPFCFNFNGLRGCLSKTCGRPHACSRCGSSAHSAQGCS